MAGSPVYGKGYHDGSMDTRQQDLLVAGVVVVGVALVKVGMVSYDKLKQMQVARMEKRMLESTVEVDSAAPAENILDNPMDENR